MKMTKQHYSQLVAALKTIDIEKIKAHKIALQNDVRVKDLEKRLRWDCFWSLNQFRSLVMNEWYSYMNDNHIDTALKAAMKELNI